MMFTKQFYRSVRIDVPSRHRIKIIYDRIYCHHFHNLLHGTMELKLSFYVYLLNNI